MTDTYKLVSEDADKKLEVISNITISKKYSLQEIEQNISDCDFRINELTVEKQKWDALKIELQTLLK